MDSVKPSAATPAKSKLARTLAKVLHLRAFSGVGIVPDDGVHDKPRSSGDRKTGARVGSLAHSFDNKKTEEEEKAAALEATLANLFASVSTVKASYAQLQLAQSPYDVDAIHEADQAVVSELKSLSELKQCYVKKQFDSSPENALILAEIKEQKSLLKTYQTTVKKMEAQVKNKESEIESLRHRLEGVNHHNKTMEKRLNQSGQMFHVSDITPKHFNTVLRHTVKSVRSFVRLMIEEAKSANWDIDAAANSIQPGIVYWKPDHKCFAFESYVCNQMFQGFNYPNFGLSKEQDQPFSERFMELKSLKARDYLAKKPNSELARFTRAKYLGLVHPRMEESFFGNLNQRNQVNTSKFPETGFFNSFAEMAKRVLMLHCLAFSFQPEASIFMISRGERFSEVYMESVAEEPFVSAPGFDPRVGFTVVPGFRIGKTVLQSQVYYSQLL